MILKKIDELEVVLTTPKKLVIIGHRNPDGDAVGSTLGLKFFLEKKGHKATVVLPNKFPNFLKWIPGTEDVLLFDKNNKDCLNALDESDMVFLLDFNALHRVGDVMKKTLEEYKNEFVLIDHHQQPDDFRYMYSDTSICSTCQMVYHFIDMLKSTESIDQQIATCLYTGIMTDTGSFRFRSTTSTTHRIIAELIDKGAENDKIHSNTFDSQSVSRLKLLGCALNNLVVKEEFSTAFITITEAEKKLYNFKKGDTDGVVNYALSVKNINLAAIFIEDKEQGIIKISFRSKGDFSVNQLSRSYFSGGGHDNAAGGKSDVSMEETITRFLELVEKHSTEINSSYEK